MESWGQGDVIHVRAAWIHRLTAVVTAGFTLIVLGCTALTRAWGTKRIMDSGAVVGTGSAVAVDTVDIDAARNAVSENALLLGHAAVKHDRPRSISHVLLASSNPSLLCLRRP